MLSRIGNIAEATSEPDLLAIKSWLEDNWPSQPQAAAICHGDLHPDNILYLDGKVTGLIDQAALTRMAMSIGPLELDAETGAAMQPLVDQLIAGYLATYRAEAPLDDDLLDYYATLRAARSYTKVIGARREVELPYVAGDGYHWALPKMFSAISNVIESTTGVKLKTS